VKALVLDSVIPIAPEIGAQVETILSKKGFDVEHIDIAQADIAYCRGCFDCWVKTPGECVIGDDAPNITRIWVQSDIVVFISEIVFGGYSSKFKRMLDRTISMLHPYFIRIQGEYHHKKRYSQYPVIIVLGVDTNNNETWNDIFFRLVGRNVINMHAPDYRTVIIDCTQHESINKTIGQFLDKMEGVA
jgi:multimeric flavodoxin WrbA